MKPRLTIAVRRGLRDLLSLVESDVDADRAAECSRWTESEFAEIQRALAYLQYIATERAAKESK